MPTGYTAAIQEKPDITFQEFARQCARAMGACVSQRECTLSQPPKLDEPSDYNLRRCRESEVMLLQLNTMSDEELQASADQAFEDESQRAAKRLKEMRITEAAYRRVLDEVEAWEPPTADHQGLKDFMIQQITDSIEWDCNTSYYDTPIGRLTGREWQAAQKEQLTRDIEYHKKAYAEEVERTKNRNAWKRQLAESLSVTIATQSCSSSA